MTHSHHFGLRAKVFANVVGFARATVLLITVLALVEGRLSLRGINCRVRARDTLPLLGPYPVHCLNGAAGASLSHRIKLLP